MTSCCPIVELRQYTLHAHRRDVLIDLFEREFIESQEALGISVIGQFRDRDDPNRFVWLRGFPGMAARGEALAAFYGGKVWQAHREAANATMLDSDNVLLLRPAPGGSGFSLAERRDDRNSEAESVVVATTHYLDDEDVADDFARFFAAAMAPTIAAAGGTIVATLATESARNNFPRLPVREDEPVFVWLCGFPDLGAYERFGMALRRCDDWRAGASPAILRQFMRKPEVLTLLPTRRSKLR
jgi:hypothetical protein